MRETRRKHRPEALRKSRMATHSIPSTNSVAEMATVHDMIVRPMFCLLSVRFGESLEHKLFRTVGLQVLNEPMLHCLAGIARSVSSCACTKAWKVSLTLVQSSVEPDTAGPTLQCKIYVSRVAVSVYSAHPATSYDDLVVTRSDHAASPFLGASSAPCFVLRGRGNSREGIPLQLPHPASFASARYA